MDFCVLVLWLHRFHKEFYVPDTESQKSALSSVVSKFSSKVAKRKKKVLQLERLHSSRLPRFSAHDGGAVRCCWHLGAWAHSVLWHVTAFIFKRWKHFARRKKRTHECHLLSFLVSWYWNFCFWYIFVSQSRQVLGFDFLYDYLLFLLSWLLTFLRDSNVYFVGSSLPRGFLLHTAGLSLYLKKKKKEWKLSLTSWGICRKTFSPPWAKVRFLGFCCCYFVLNSL